MTDFGEIRLNTANTFFPQYLGVKAIRVDFFPKNCYGTNGLTTIMYVALAYGVVVSSDLL